MPVLLGRRAAMLAARSRSPRRTHALSVLQSRLAGLPALENRRRPRRSACRFVVARLGLVFDSVVPSTAVLLVAASTRMIAHALLFLAFDRLHAMAIGFRRSSSTDGTSDLREVSFRKKLGAHKRWMHTKGPFAGAFPRHDVIVRVCVYPSTRTPSGRQIPWFIARRRAGDFLFFLWRASPVADARESLE